MRVDVIRERLQLNPFRPFTIRITDGRSFAIRHREMVSLLRTAIYLVVIDEHRMIIIDPLMVVTIEYDDAESMTLPASYKPRPRDDSYDQESEE